ncbi:MAG TPA: TetR family transcriptional regulator C-terminal domain-containing protein [Phenylobacterium sp.]|nr:TetR family transcriptional regulator C-terminal domain-containing protein [Phenylobacterium sp.]
MARPSHREKILAEGLRVVHERGFGGASVRDIVRAAGVPQGSFTNHFASKEAFGLEVLELYFRQSQAMIDATLGNQDLKPLARIAAYVDGALCRQQEDGMKNGCLVGNFSAEVADQSEPIRRRLVEMLRETEAAIAACLSAAVDAGELAADTDVDGVAGVIQAGLQGATLIAKAERSPEPVERFKRVLFGAVLRAA